MAARLPLIVLVTVAAACGGSPPPAGAPPATTPVSAPSAEAAREPLAPALADATPVGARDPIDIVNAQRALTLRVEGSLRVASTPWEVSLLLARSGAMRLELRGPQAIAAVSDGATMIVRTPAGERRESALRAPVLGTDPVAALSPFDLVEIWLPAPLPAADTNDLMVATSTSGPHTRLEWLCASCDSPVLRRAVIVDTEQGRVVRRERYGEGGELELVVEWPESTLVRWQRLPGGDWLELRIDSEIRVEDVSPGTFHVGG